MMNTRLLMILRVTVATPQSIGAVPHGTRRTVVITGGDFEARDFAELCYLVEARTGWIGTSLDDARRVLGPPREACWEFLNSRVDVVFSRWVKGG
jgi:hypothetical protein